MTLLAIQIGLCAAAGIAAWALGHRDARHRPVAWYLAAVLCLVMAREGLSQLLPPGPAVRQGSALMLRHLDQAAYIGLLLAVPALAMALFLRRRPWPIVAIIGTVVWGVVALSYPGLRGPELLSLYTVIELAGGLFAVGCIGMWRRSPRFVQEGVTTAIMCGVVLSMASLATVVLPSFAGVLALERWAAIVGLHALAFAIVLVLQLQAFTKEEEEARL